jgi:ABC-type nitrate/sulfonate/bicarbonate transport system ATPase subunit
LVTHDVDEALQLASRIVLLGADGRIRREWRPGSDGPNGELREEILSHYRVAEQ